MNDRRIKEAGSLRSLFSQQWFHLRGLIQLKRRQKRNQVQIDKTIEEIVDGTDGKIRIVSDYQQQLIQCAQSQIDYVNSIYQQIDKITQLDEQSLKQSDLLQAIFYTSESMYEFIAKEQELADFIKENHLSVNDTVYGLMKITKQQKTVFMPGLVNGKVINDVKQTQVSFAQRHLGQLAKSDKEILSSIKQYLHDNIVNQVKIELAPMLAHANGMACILSSEDFKNPNTYLSTLKSVMLTPDKILHYNESTLCTNRFGVLALNSSIEKERQFTIQELTFTNKSPHLLLAVAIKVKDLL